MRNAECGVPIGYWLLGIGDLGVALDNRRPGEILSGDLRNEPEGASGGVAPLAVLGY